MRKRCVSVNQTNPHLIYLFPLSTSKCNIANIRKVGVTFFLHDERDLAARPFYSDVRVWTVCRFGQCCNHDLHSINTKGSATDIWKTIVQFGRLGYVFKYLTCIYHMNISNCQPDRLLHGSHVRASHDLLKLGNSARQHQQLHGLLCVGAATLVHDCHCGKHLSPHHRPVCGHCASAHLLALLAHEASTALYSNDDCMAHLHFMGGIPDNSGIHWNNQRPLSC